MQRTIKSPAKTSVGLVLVVVSFGILPVDLNSPFNSGLYPVRRQTQGRMSEPDKSGEPDATATGHVFLILAADERQ